MARGTCEKGGIDMICRHPVIVGGKCVDCGIIVNGAETPHTGVAPQDEQTPTAEAKTPADGQETPKKATRKRKA